MTTETNAATPTIETTPNSPSPDGAAPTTPSSTAPSPSPAPAPTAATDLTPAPAPAPAATDPNAPPAENADADPWAGVELDDETKAFIGEKTPAEVAKELQNAQKLLGKKAIGIPGKDSTPEEQRAFHKARGVPESEEGYELAPVVEKIKAVAPEGWAPDTALEQRFRKAARLSNMSNGEAQQFAEHFLGEEFKAREEFVKTEVAATKEATSLFTQHIGPDRTVFDSNFARGMNAIGLDTEGVDVFLGAYGGNGKARFNMARVVAEIGARYGEGTTPPGLNPSGGGVGMSKQQARGEMDRILADPANQEAYNDPTHAKHQEITREITRLGKIERGITAT